MAANTVRAQVSPPFTASAELDSKGVTQKRQRHPSRKALENAIQDTTAELSKRAKALWNAADVYTALREKTSVIDESALKIPTQKYEEILNGLEGLYAQDKRGGTLNEAEIIRQSSQSNLQYAPTALEKAKATRLNEQEEEDRASRKSRHLSRASSSHSSASSVRVKALAEAAAAKKQAECDRIMAEKELERRQRDAEEERLLEERRAKYDRDMALLAAEKLTAVADAKLDAIEKSME